MLEFKWTFFFGVFFGRSTAAMLMSLQVVSKLFGLLCRCFTCRLFLWCLLLLLLEHSQCHCVTNLKTKGNYFFCRSHFISKFRQRQAHTHIHTYNLLGFFMLPFWFFFLRCQWNDALFFGMRFSSSGTTSFSLLSSNWKKNWTLIEMLLVWFWPICQSVWSYKNKDKVVK